MALPTPSEMESTIPETTGSICSKLEALWSLANKVSQAWAFLFNSTGTAITDDAKALFSDVAVPTGGIIMWALDLPPSGWLTCNGQTISRTTYSALFAKLGTRYGSGDGTTTFSLPNMQRRVPFGASSSNTAGSTGGAESVALAMTNLPAEPLTLASGVTGLIVREPGAGTDSLDTANANISTFSPEEVFGDLGDGTPIDILNPYFSVHYIIKT